MKTFAIIGTGAIGGYCAVKLQQAGFDVHCLIGRDYLHVKKHGLTLIEGEKSYTLPIQAYHNISDMPVCDVVLIALKTTANALFIPVLSNIVNDNTTVVVLQNGIGMEQEIANYIPSTQIVGGSCMLKVDKHAPGVITHSHFNNIEFAQYYSNYHESGLTPIIEQLVADFTSAGFNVTATEHLPTLRWKKLIANIPVNGLSVVLDAATIELVEDPTCFNLLCALTKEVVTTAIKCGAKITDDFYNARLKVLESFKSLPKSYSSMKHDFDAKQTLELDAIYKNAIHIASLYTVSMPLTTMLYQQLSYLNNKNISRRH